MHPSTMSYIIICLHHMKSSPHHSTLINTPDPTSGPTTVSLLWVFLGFSLDGVGSVSIVSCVFNLNGADPLLTTASASLGPYVTA